MSGLIKPGSRTDETNKNTVVKKAMKEVVNGNIQCFRSINRITYYFKGLLTWKQNCKETEVNEDYQGKEQNLGLMVWF
jgi:hypothetical protein